MSGEIEKMKNEQETEFMCHRRRREVVGLLERDTAHAGTWSGWPTIQTLENIIREKNTAYLD